MSETRTLEFFRGPLDGGVSTLDVDEGEALCILPDEPTDPVRHVYRVHGERAEYLGKVEVVRCDGQI